MSKITFSKLTKFEFDGDSDKYVFPGQSWTYQILLDRTYDTDQNIEISYHDSDGEFGMDFDGPTSVTIRAGSDKVKFNVNIFIRDGVYEKSLRIRAAFDDEVEEISNYIVSLTDCPWYVAPIKKGFCKPMIGLPEEYQEKYCGDVREGDTFRYTGPGCKDIYFWSEDRCGDFFSLDEYPMLYLDEEC